MPPSPGYQGRARHRRRSNQAGPDSTAPSRAPTPGAAYPHARTSNPRDLSSRKPADGRGEYRRQTWSLQGFPRRRHRMSIEAAQWPSGRLRTMPIDRRFEQGFTEAMPDLGWRLVGRVDGPPPPHQVLVHLSCLEPGPAPGVKEPGWTSNSYRWTRLSAVT